MIQFALLFLFAKTVDICGSGKYQIAETKKVQKIYGFSIYATIEDFENEDKGV